MHDANEVVQDPPPGGDQEVGRGAGIGPPGGGSAMVWQAGGRIDWRTAGVTQLQGAAVRSSASMSRMVMSRRPWSSMMPEAASAARRRLRVSGVVPR